MNEISGSVLILAEGILFLFLSEVPKVMRSGRVKIDAALIQISTRHGYCSFGISVEAIWPAIGNTSYVIAHVIPKMPRTNGDGIFHISKFVTFVEVDEELSLMLPHQ